MKRSKHLQHLLQAALHEDVGDRDITSEILIPAQAKAKAELISRESGLFCGEVLAKELIRMTDPSLKMKFSVRDGGWLKKNRKVLSLEGRVRPILAVERTLINFLGHLSGIATQTAKYVKQGRRYRVTVLDTRKTTPLWRELEKYAVRIGGGKNHRMGLYDAIFVKENHRPYGHLDKLRGYAGQFEIEVRNLRELSEAVMLRPHVILFDNFTPRSLRKAVRMARRAQPKTILEASGGIDLKNFAQFAATGVDWISIGSLTHSVRSFDFSLLLKPL